MTKGKIPTPDPAEIERIDRDTMLQAITTTFSGPTNFRGARIIARCDAGSLSWECDDRIHVRKSHIAAALALAGKFGWLNGHDLVGGGVHRGGYAFVLVQKARVRHAWTRDGRTLSRDGRSAVTITRETLRPYETDVLAARIAELLNTQGDGIDEALAALSERE